MKKLIEFTKNWKHRNLLHVVGGFLMGAFLSWLVSLKGTDGSDGKDGTQLNIGTTFIIEEI